MSGIKWPEPPIVTPGKADSDPPSDAIVLFDGKDLSAWENGDQWIVKDGVATVKDTDITTKQSFGDCQLHVEWSAPVPATGESQGRGNSGVFLMDQYEVQVLDSYDNKTYFDGQASAIYKQTPPMVNAMRQPGEWNTYDIVWNAPKFKEDGSLESPAYVTVLHNGVLTLNHFAARGHDAVHRRCRITKSTASCRSICRTTATRCGTATSGCESSSRSWACGNASRIMHDHDTGKDTPVKKTAAK